MNYYNPKLEYFKSYSQYVEENDICMDERFELLERISCGTFGEVSKVYDKELHVISAKKIFNEGRVFESSAKREIDFLVRLNRRTRGFPPNVVGFYEAYVSDHSGWSLVMEMLGSDLHSFLSNSPEPLNKLQITTLARSIIEGLRFVHDSKIVHCDLKLANLVIIPETNICCKVSSFS